MALAKEVLSALATVRCCVWTLVGAVCASWSTARSAGLAAC